jgi:hypothetical protein
MTLGEAIAKLKELRGNIKEHDLINPYTPVSMRILTILQIIDLLEVPELVGTDEGVS